MHHIVMESEKNIFKPIGNTIAKAGSLLGSGQLVAFPTETVYGLGGNALDDSAVAAIFKAKARPSFNPLIVHVPDLETAERYGVFNAQARLLAQTFWPGALTLVVPRHDDCPLSHLVSAGLETVALRVPAHPLAQDLLKAADLPIAAPSANRSGAVSPTIAEHVAHSLGDSIDMILDGGPCQVGLESTVIDATGEQCGFLRPGGIAKEDIEAITGPLLSAGEDPDAPKSPGMLKSHYAPNLPVYLNCSARKPGGAFLGFGPHSIQSDLNLSEKGDLQEAAANLFAMMRQLDRDEFSSLCVAPIPNEGLGLAINDRLQRASAPKEKGGEE